jgi:hypothetical protein
VKFLSGNSPTLFEVLQAILVCLALLAAWIRPTACAPVFSGAEALLRRLSAHRFLSCLTVALLPLLLRGMLLPVYGIPEPGVHDEYGFLLQAATFASGHWTNPTPPVPENFESIYILVRPTYTAQYQIAQGLVLAAGKALTGMPWITIYLGMGLACGLLVWMLDAWLSPVLALAGGLIAVFQFGVLSYWMNSYFGGTVPCIGGTLVLGSLPRLLGKRPMVHSLLLASGLAILMHSRPLEALILFGITLGVMGYWLLATHELNWPRAVLSILAPLATVLLLSTAFMAFYNGRVTGNPLELPYRLNQKEYGTPQGFYWQPPITVDKFPNAQLRDEYLAQLRLHERRHSIKALIAGTFGRLRTFWGFFLTPVFTLPLIFLPRIWRGPGMGIVLAASILFGLEYLTFFAFLPQYAAPVTGLILLVILQCLRQMRSYSSAGLFLSRALPVLCVASVAIPMAGRFVEHAEHALPAGISRIWASEFGQELDRARLLKGLIAQGGRHLVIVHYRPEHVVDTEWVYNDPDIPNSPVIWAREIDSESIPKLIARFPGRKVWIGEPDANPPALVPYPTSASQ